MIMEENINGGGASPETKDEGTRGKGLGFGKKVGSWLDDRLDPVLNRKVGENQTVSWGLLLLIAVAIYAVYMIVKNVLYFF